MLQQCLYIDIFPANAAISVIQGFICIAREIPSSGGFSSLSVANLTNEKYLIT